MMVVLNGMSIIAKAPSPPLGDDWTTRYSLVETCENGEGGAGKNEVGNEKEEKDVERDDRGDSDDEENEEAGECFGEIVLQRMEASHCFRSNSIAE